MLQPLKVHFLGLVGPQRPTFESPFPWFGGSLLRGELAGLEEKIKDKTRSTGGAQDLQLGSSHK